ncbi:MAG: glycoside hydrolase family 27 protein, partial [Kiritimatiellae bacterium]|nr:glycoside hydrolase family 27 protein [Kiritimatiellia bacterium]
MKRLSTLCLSLSLSALWMQAEPVETPTMGWSSWNTYRVNISDRLIMKQADLMVELGLDRCGYRYVNIDDGYFGGRDTNGRLKTHHDRFPKGLKEVVDHIHALGLKAGIYSDGGEDTCGCFWDKDILGSGVGFYGHDDQDARFFFKEHDFDFIKVDFCGGDGPQNAKHLTLDERERYTAIRKAIDRVKPGVRLNVCRWNYPGTWVREVGSSWRIRGDITPTWGRVKAIILENLNLSAYAAPG